MHRHAVEYSTYPRGPRSGPGCSVPVRHHLIGPIRPTRGHIAISPHGGLYAMPSLCGSALLLGDPRVGLVSRVTPVHTALRNCTRDEGRSFEVGNQVLISNHRKLLWPKAMVVNVAEKSGRDSDRKSTRL